MVMYKRTGSVFSTPHVRLPGERPSRDAAAAANQASLFEFALPIERNGGRPSFLARLFAGQLDLRCGGRIHPAPLDHVVRNRGSDHPRGPGGIIRDTLAGVQKCRGDS
jgi:hypothetical protein